MTHTHDHERLAAIRHELNTAVIGDILDLLALPHQFLPQPIQAMAAGMTLVGRAMPVLIADVFGPQKRPFGKLTDALDQLRPGEIYLARSGRLDCSAWGEIMTAAARRREAAGAVIDGYHRDTLKILEQNWPVFSRGAYAQDAAIRASVQDYRVPVEVDGVRIDPGDLIVGDQDGVVVVPASVEVEVVERALGKVRAENVVRKAIEAGMSSTEALTTYGIL